MIKLFKPFISEEAKVNVMRVLNSDQIAQGPEVELFEKELEEKETQAQAQQTEMHCSSGGAWPLSI